MPIEQNRNPIYNSGMDDENWITLSTTPPAPQTEFDRLLTALEEAGVETNIEENVARQCENDVAFWLRVRRQDLPLAWNISQKIAK